jgi:hypothetical protein
VLVSRTYTLSTLLVSDACEHIKRSGRVIRETSCSSQAIALLDRRARDRFAPLAITHDRGDDVTASVHEESRR